MIIILEIWFFKKFLLGFICLLINFEYRVNIFLFLKWFKNNKLIVMRIVFVVVVFGYFVIDFFGGDIDGDGVGNGLVFYID